MRRPASSLAAIAAPLAAAALASGSTWGAKKEAEASSAGPGALFAILAMLCGALALLGVSLLLARRAASPAARKARRKSFEAGRIAAMRAPPLTEAEAMERLRAGDVGTLAEAKAEPGHVVARISRPRGHSCESIAGRLAGMFEAAWARDVHVEHVSCGGKKRAPCTFVVTRQDARGFSAGGRRAAAASTRGS